MWVWLHAILSSVVIIIENVSPLVILMEDVICIWDQFIRVFAYKKGYQDGEHVSLWVYPQIITGQIICARAIPQLFV